MVRSFGDVENGDSGCFVSYVQSLDKNAFLNFGGFTREKAMAKKKAEEKANEKGIARMVSGGFRRPTLLGASGLRASKGVRQENSRLSMRRDAKPNLLSVAGQNALATLFAEGIDR